MDTSLPSTFPPEDATVIEGYSFGRFVRLCGALCFLVINPLFFYIWIDAPKFVQGPVDFPEIIMTVITAGMVLLGIWGLMINFAKTRVSAGAIEWGIFRRSRLTLDQIRCVDSVICLRMYNVIAVGYILRLVSEESNKLEIAGGTEELYQSFLWLQSKYPK